MDATGKKIAILVDIMYQEMEVWYPLFRFQEAGATVVAGNESFNLSGPGSHSLYLPSGSSATSPEVCVETLDVFARFVAKNRGTILLSSLKVDAVVRDGEGHTFLLPAGVNTGGATVGLMYGSSQT